MTQDTKHTNNTHSDTETLNNSVRELNRTLKKYNTFHHVFARGITSGFAGFLGATLVVAIFVAILSQMEKIPFLGDSNVIIYINDVLEENSKIPLNIIQETE